MAAGDMTSFPLENILTMMAFLFLMAVLIPAFCWLGEVIYTFCLKPEERPLRTVPSIFNRLREMSYAEQGLNSAYSSTSSVYSVCVKVENGKLPSYQEASKPPSYEEAMRCARS